MRIVAGRPTQSNAWSAPRPPVSLRIALAVVSPATRKSVAPCSAARSAFASVTSTPMIGPAPTARAACSADSPTPPSPMTTTDSPARTRAVFSTAPAPVCTAQPSTAACSSGTDAGSGTTPAAGTIVSSANAAVPRPG